MADCGSEQLVGAQVAQTVRSASFAASQVRSRLGIGGSSGKVAAASALP